MRSVFLILLLILFTAFLYSQAEKKSHNNDMDMKVKGTSQLPVHWEARFDKPDAGKKDMHLIKEKNYYHFITGPAAIYYNPKNKEVGEYRIESNFIQIKPSKHPEAYGVIFGGSNLQKENQHYFYFLVRQDGKYLIKERNGNDTKEIMNWTADKYVNAQDKNGETINKLSVTVNNRDVIFGANGKAVMFLKKSGLGNTNGIAGLRINHNLNVKASGLTIDKF